MVAAVPLAFALGGCSGGGQRAEPTSKPTSSTAEATTTTVEPIVVHVELGRTSVVGVGVPHADPQPMDPATARAIARSVDDYVQTALVAPLAGARADLSGLVGKRAAERLTRGQHDRAVLTTEGLPEGVAAQVTLEPLRLVGLTEGFGSLPLVSAAIDFAFDLATTDGTVHVRHLGELVLSNDGGWKVIGYEMVVIRDDGSAATTTTATVTP